jgi:hypothetical protein
MLVSFLRVFMGLMRVLVGFLVIALFMVVRRRVVGLGCVFVMLGCLAMCFVCHKSSVSGMNPRRQTLPATANLTVQPDEFLEDSRLNEFSSSSRIDIDG